MNTIEKRTTQILIFLSVCLISWGGFVHNTDSSLACPDWPKCFGKWMPLMEGQVLIEHGHRMLGTLVGFFVVLLNIFVWKSKDIGRKYKNRSLLLLFVVILQGVLGGITVLYRLPTIISTGHLVNSLFFLSFLVYMETYFGRNRISEKKTTAFDNTSLIFLILLFAQAALGAYLRHEGAGMACGIGPKSLLLCLDPALDEFRLWPDSSMSRLHMSHRLFACFLSLVSLSLFVQSFKEKSLKKFLGFGQFFLVLLQIYLGLKTVETGLSLYPTTLHLTVLSLIILSVAKLVFIHHFENKNFFWNSHYIKLFKNVSILGKPKLTSLVVVSMLAGVYLTGETIPLEAVLLLSFLVTLLVMGSCLLNCWLEKEEDTKMIRTKDREEAISYIGQTKTMMIGVGMTVFSFSGLWFYFNSKVALLGLMGSIVYLLFYTPMKKISTNALFVGALSGAVPPLLGQIAILESVNRYGLALFFIMLIWQLPHFLAISLFRKDDYELASIRVLPVEKGIRFTQYLILFYSLLLLVATLVPFYYERVGNNYLRWSFLIGLLPILLAILGVANGRNNVTKWARYYFFSTLIYLPSIFGVLIFSVVKGS